MYAAVIQAQIPQDKVEAITQVYRDMEATIRQIPNLQAFYVLMDPGTGEGLSVAVYASQADAQAAESSAPFRASFAKLNEAAGGAISYTRKVFDVIVST